MHKYKPRWRAAWRKIGVKAKYYRSSWEANFARYLQFLKEKKIIRNWWHEPKTFYFNKIKRGVRSYLPDFKVNRQDCTHYWVEVKGWMNAKSKTKIKRFRKYYPKEQLFIVDKKWFDKYSKKLSLVCDGWEHPTPRAIKPKKNNGNNKRRDNNMAIECMDFKPHKSGCLIGYAHLYSDKTGIEVRGCPLFEKNGGKWVNFPDNKYEEEGETKHSWILRYRNKEYREEFTKQAVKAIESWCYANKDSMDKQEEEQSISEEKLPF